MIDVILIVVFYLMPLVFFWKRGYDEEEGMFILIGLIPFLNLLFTLLIVVVEGSEWVIRKIKGN